MYASSLTDSGSIQELSPRSSQQQISQQYFTLHSAIATSLDFDILSSQWHQKEPTYEISKVLLFKGVPEDTMEIELLTLCQPFGSVKDIFVKKQKRYAFIQFERVDQAQRCFENFTKLPPTIRGNSLYVFCTGKDTITKTNSTLGLPSRFLLLGFGKAGLNIDSSLIVQLLSPFGRCVKAAIFQAKTTQAFVEMDDVLQAIRVYESLDGQIVFNSLCVEVIFTEEQEIFHHAKPTSNFGISTAATLDHLPPMSNYGIKSQTSFQNPWSEPKNPSSCIWPNAVGVQKMTSHPQNIMAYRSETMIRPGSLTQMSPEKQYHHHVQKEPMSAPPMTMAKPFFHSKEEKSDTILLIRNLPVGVAAKMLFRLFGMYGNVMKVKIFFKNPENALVEYQTAEQAELAKTYLNNCLVYGNNIFVTNSKQGVVVDISALKKGEETQYMGDFANSPEHRYKFSGSKNHMNIVPPSKVLHLSNLCDDKEDDFYINLFREYGLIKRFTFLKGIERMALMEMSSIDDAVKILMNFHNFNINGKYLKVSFSKYQKIKDF